MKDIMHLMIRVVTLLLAALMNLSGPANADTFPAKPITFIAPMPPGGPLDLMTRALAQSLSAGIGGPVIVENIAGAGGSIAMGRLAKAAPDGYTIAMGHTGSIAINPAIYGNKLPYDPVKDFSPLSLAVTFVNILVVDPKLSLNSVADLVSYAKSNPTKVAFGSAGNGSTNHLSGELLKSLTGAPMEHVPYKGSAPAMTDLLAGRLTFMFDTLNTSLPQIRANRVRALAVTSSARSQYLPDVPTMTEAGVSGYAEAGSDLWMGVLGPAAMPRPVVEKLNQHLLRVLKSAEMAEKVKAQYYETRSSTPEEFRRVIEADVVKWGRIVQASGARAN